MPPLVQRPSSAKHRLPSARFLLSAATHAFLLRQHARCLALLSQLFLTLAPPTCAWTAAEGLEGKGRAREDVRRQAAVLWLTSVVCFVGEPAQLGAATGDSSQPASSTLPSPLAAYGGSLTGDSRTDDAVRFGSAAAIVAALVDRCASLYALPATSPPLAPTTRFKQPRRTSAGAGHLPASTSTSSSSGTSPPAGLSRPRAPPLPAQVTQTLLLAAQKLSLPPEAAQALVLGPFQAAIPLALQHRLAGLSRARESEDEFGLASRSGDAKSEGEDGWLGSVLDAYEGVVEAWAVHVLGAAGDDGRSQAIRFVREDMVLGRARKADLIAAVERLSCPSSSDAQAFPYRPPSPGLSSSSSSSSSSSVDSVLTATPANPFPALSNGKNRGRPPPAPTPLKAHVEAVRRFLSPRPPRGRSAISLASIDDVDDSDSPRHAALSEAEPACTTISLAPSPPLSPAKYLLALVRRYLPFVRLPAVLAFAISLILAFRGRRRAALDGGVGDEVRRRLARNSLFGW